MDLLVFCATECASEFYGSFVDDVALLVDRELVDHIAALALERDAQACARLGRKRADLKCVVKSERLQDRVRFMVAVRQFFADGKHQVDLCRSDELYVIHEQISFFFCLFCARLAAKNALSMLAHSSSSTPASTANV